MELLSAIETTPVVTLEGGYGKLIRLHSESDTYMLTPTQGFLQEAATSPSDLPQGVAMEVDPQPSRLEPRIKMEDILTAELDQNRNAFVSVRAPLFQTSCALVEYLTNIVLRDCGTEV